MSGMKKVTIVALNDGSATSITGPMEVFNMTGRLWNLAHGLAPTPFFDVQVVSLTGDPVQCMGGMTIGVQGSIFDVVETDLILISSVINIENNLSKQHKVVPWLVDRYNAGAQIAGICTGVFVLAATGLLDGKVATTHWGVAQEFKQLFPLVDLKPERLFTDATDLYCSGAYSSCIDLSLYLVEKFCGREVALQTAKIMVHDINRISQTPYTPFNFQRNHTDDSVLQAQRYIEKEFSQQINLDQLAQNQGMGRRTFERRFKAATGDTPNLYIQRVRVEKAKRILESEQKNLEEISFAVGYEDSGFFRKIFIRHTGLNPRAYRERFQRSVDFQC